MGSRGTRCITMPNVVKISQAIAEILWFFDFSRWRPSAMLHFKSLSAFLVVLARPIYISKSNFIKIGQVIYKISQYFRFSNSEILLAGHVRRSAKHSNEYLWLFVSLSVYLFVHMTRKRVAERIFADSRQYTGWAKKTGTLYSCPYLC